MDNWFDIIQINTHIYLIRERLDMIDERFHTQYTNIYVILGTHSAILFDTGSGLKEIRPHIEKIIGNRDLIIINSHNHFDHIGGNKEFPSVHIHRFDLKRITKPIDISFLKTSSSLHAAEFAKNDYLLESSHEHQLLIGDEKFNLGDIEVEIISTPGHTPGSICLLTNRGELFTGDTVHFGAVYLPSDDQYNNYKHSLLQLNSMIDDHPNLVLYPSHEDYGLDGKIITELLGILENFQEYSKDAEYDEFLEAYWFVEKQFRIIFPQDYQA
ncbi:MAG: MBL fold metallo-hydrolase [Candidatus Heimdallarchaeota archaeon]|nr:MBL fold metallo-hydrolase [Candidatus Heimdallarchaeota archaeon]